MKRGFPTRPIVGVGAVIVRGDSVLLVQRGTPPLVGEWSLPGGAVEIGETLQEAVKREIQEETNLEIRVGPLVELFERIQRDGGRVAYHYVIADYLAWKIRGRLKASSDVRAARFVSRTELVPYHLTETAQRVIARGFELARKSRPKP
ncbi:MAG: NUDIX hydrolase [Acidobacteriia bacterium]|nr:NUDIX hydrolase [Terriglobia bacterium]